MADESPRGVHLRFGTTALNHRTLRLLGGRLPRLTGGWMPWLSYGPVRLPERSDGWVRLRPILSGICGTDLSLVTGRASAILSPFASFPAVLGHEVVATVAEGPRAGERVVVDPLISCRMRGLPDCRWCAAGWPSLCLNDAEGDLAPGPMIGFCADLPGGWSEAMLAHETQLHPVPDVLSDEEAVLVEPLSVAMHAVLQRVPNPGERVLVIGGGAVGLCAVAALHMTNPDLDVTVVARYPAQARLAEALGATRVLRSAGDRLIEEAAAVAGARVYRSIYGKPVLTGGFPHVFDAVGSKATLHAAIDLAGARGRVTMLGGPGPLSDLDWTLTWTRELEIAGTYVYGRETSLEGSPHTYEHVMERMVAARDLELGALVTHRFALRDWRRAMAASLDRSRSGAVKVAFEPPPARAATSR